MSFEKRRGVAVQKYKREADWKEAGVYVNVEFIIYELQKRQGVAEHNYKRGADWKEAGVYVNVERIIYELQKT